MKNGIKDSNFQISNEIKNWNIEPQLEVINKYKEQINADESYKLNTFLKFIFQITIVNKIILLIIISISFYFNQLYFWNKKIKLRKLDSDYSEITMTLTGIGEKYILYENFIPLPDVIIINGDDAPPNTLLHNLERNENIIIIRWYEKLDTCAYMFYYVNYITKIDLSKFDSSKVTSTEYMFYQSKNLEFINFTNFNTPSLLDMSYMFYNCQKITSLDLSSFETSKVTNMISLFNYAENLEYINISNFDTSSVTNMKYLFMGCSKITSLNLSHFKTPSLKKIGGMLHGCESLTFLDISNIDSSNVDNFASFFLIVKI